MLDFFRKYQRYFFTSITFVVASSFVFLGTYDVLNDKNPDKKDGVCVQLIDGTKLMLSRQRKMAKFLSSDLQDYFLRPNSVCNLFNDGVIRNDILSSPIADILVNNYFHEMKRDLAERLQKVKKFKPYKNIENPDLSVSNLWEKMVPGLLQQIDLLVSQDEVSFKTYEMMRSIFEKQKNINPELVRRILALHQQQQKDVDQKLFHADMTPFGFYTIQDWFGQNFIDLVAQFIFNTAKLSEQKGYFVSCEEAKADLLRNFETAKNKFKIKNISLSSHLQDLGFDEQSAIECWQNVLLFRRYFEGAANTCALDSYTLRQMYKFSNEKAKLDIYEWPRSICTKDAQDLTLLQYYIKSVCHVGKDGMPISFRSVDEVEKTHPELVHTTFKAKIAEVSKREVAAKATMKQIWDWQLDPKNWTRLKKHSSSLPLGPDFKAIDSLDTKQRSQLDTIARDALVDDHPEWVEDALARAPLVERVWSAQDENFGKKGFYYRLEDFEKVEDKHILTFEESRSILRKKELPIVEFKNPLLTLSQQAMACLKKNHNDPRWLQTGDHLMDQFKLIRKEIEIPRNSEESWMKDQVFQMMNDSWSTIHVGSDGQVVFFYFQERKQEEVPVLEPLYFGKEILGQDAKRYLAEKMMELVKKKNAILIPIQREENESI